MMSEGIVRSMVLSVGDVDLDADLIVPPGAKGIVVFAHGSGSGRKSPRNTFIAEVLRERGIASLLFDLLTEPEDTNYETRFDISLLSDRLAGATTWLFENNETKYLRIGLFGASTGAAAALRVAASLGSDIDAVVSRGGRVDLAGDILGDVSAPTLLIVGGFDRDVLQLNRESYKKLMCEKRLEVIPGASHLFEEPGKLYEVARIATNWFESHLNK